MVLARFYKNYFEVVQERGCTRVYVVILTLDVQKWQSSIETAQ